MVAAMRPCLSIVAQKPRFSEPGKNCHAHDPTEMLDVAQINMVQMLNS